jgi:hypothetical protein
VTIDGWIDTGLGMGVPHDHSVETAREHSTPVDERREGKEEEKRGRKNNEGERRSRTGTIKQHKRQSNCNPSIHVETILDSFLLLFRGTGRLCEL